MTAQIVFENFYVKLRDRVLYNNLEFTIGDGDRYIFLGPNGIGKSLLLELLFLGNSNELNERYKGLQVSGKILDCNGNDMLSPKTERKIAYVAQNEDFYKEKTIKGICETACRGVGIELNEDKLDYLLKAFDIYEKKNQKIKNNVSFGEGKIVHIVSRLLKLEATNILLLDEPLNHLSFHNSKIFNNLLRQEVEKKQNLIIIMISHCRAMNFTDKAMIYNRQNQNIVFKPYHSYDCFSEGECVI